MTNTAGTLANATNSLTNLYWATEAYGFALEVDGDALAGMRA